MNRFVYGRGWVFCVETNGEDVNGTEGGAAAEEVVEDGVDTVVDDGTVADTDGGEKKVDEPKDMQAAIDAKLGYSKDKDGNRLDAAGNITHDKDGNEVKAAEPAAKPVPGKESETHHANGKPKKDATGQALDDKGVVVKQAPAKAKTAAELDLKPDEKKALNAKTGARFAEVITTLKARETEIATLTEQMKPLAEARDTMISILEETGTSSDQLSAYLEFNRMLQSNNAKDLETALGMVEAQRVALYKALGKEPAGGDVDLLADFPDLAEDVTEARITRERALELAQARRTQAASTAATKRNEQQQQSVQQVQKARQDALGAITAWTAEIGKKDIDFKAKEDKLLEQVDEVINTYPPNQWLPTLKLLYSGIVVPKGTPKIGGHQPIRPSGAKPGAKAPQNMFEAMWGGEKAPS